MLVSRGFKEYSFGTNRSFVSIQGGQEYAKRLEARDLIKAGEMDTGTDRKNKERHNESDAALSSSSDVPPSKKNEWFRAVKIFFALYPI